MVAPRQLRIRAARRGRCAIVAGPGRPTVQGLLVPTIPPRKHLREAIGPVPLGALRARIHASVRALLGPASAGCRRDRPLAGDAQGGATLDAEPFDPAEDDRATGLFVPLLVQASAQTLQLLSREPRGRQLDGRRGGARGRTPGRQILRGQGKAERQGQAVDGQAPALAMGAGRAQLHGPRDMQGQLGLQGCGPTTCCPKRRWQGEHHVAIAGVNRLQCRQLVELLGARHSRPPAGQALRPGAGCFERYRPWATS
mmetsp:Transcript_65249/g.199595  ORF Transcript_65249/g.199595 Transcript_65249/m.199595 type:complete len:255 (+) Transcript_65249:1134-1898(+)